MQKKEVVQSSIYNLPLFKSIVDISTIPTIVCLGSIIKTEHDYLLFSKMAPYYYSFINLLTGKILLTTVNKNEGGMSGVPSQDFIDMLIESGVRPKLFHRNIDSMLRLQSRMLIEPMFFIPGDVINRKFLLCKKEDGSATFVNIHNGNRWTDSTIHFDSEGRLTRATILTLFRNELDENFTLHYFIKI